MTAEVSAALSSALSLTAADVVARLRSWRGQAVVAFVVYLVICIVYFGVPVLGHFGSHAVSGTADQDASLYMWFLAWWPHAILHGLNPFHTTALFVPHGVDLGGDVLIPGLALLLSPVTLLAGPIASYNVIMLASPVLASLCTFLLCRYLTERVFASLVGGYLFGFSAYMLIQMLGHLHLVVVFPIPAAVHLTLRLFDDRISRRRYVVLAGLSLWMLLTTSTEVALSFVGFATVALVVAAALVKQVRGRLLTGLPWIVGACVLGGALAGPVIYFGLTAGVTGLGDAGPVYGGDALGFFIPSNLVRLGRTYFAALSARFAGEQQGLYLGPVLVLIIARYVTTRWGLAATRALVVILAVIVIATFGSYLHIAAVQTIPLPWKWIDHSLLMAVLPERFAIYVALIAAVIAALWLAGPRRGGWRIAKWVAAAVAVASLIPNLSTVIWHDVPFNPSLFTTHQYRRVLARNEVVLMLPADQFSDAMLWQAKTGMWFRQAGGYVNRTFPEDYTSDPLWPALQQQVAPTAPALRSFITRRGVDAVIVNPTLAGPWPAVLAQIGLVGRSVGGVTVYRVPTTLSR